MIFRFSDNFEHYKMAACSQKGCLRLLVVLLSITVSTQQVYLQPSNTSNTECGDGGVIDGKDQVVMVGFVIADGTMPHTFEFFKSRVGDAFFFADCTINVDVNGCFSQSTSPCYCREMSGNNYTVVYNRTANILDSVATLRLSYHPLISDQHLPLVHDAERVTVTIGGGGSSIPFSNICSQVFEPGKSYDFEICGENLKGAEFYIGTDAIVVSWKTTINNCSSFLSVTLGTMMPLTFAYRETQGCLRHRSTSCTLTKACGQDISCSFSKTSNCKEGLVSNEDFFTVSCTIDKSVAGNTTRPEFFVGSNTNPDCPVPLSLCRGNESLHCNCVDNGGTYTVYFNKTAVFKYSQTEIRLILENSDSYGSAFTDIVEGPGEAQCTLNGEIISDRYSGKCPFSIAKGTGTKITYTCNSALSPVMTYISFNNTDYQGSASVVIDPPESGVGEYIFSSKICGIAVHSGSCNATLGSESEPACDDTCLIITVGVVVVVVIGGTILVLIMFWKKRLVCWEKTK